MNFFFTVYVWCDDARDIRLWPAGVYNESYTEQFIRAFTAYDDDNCITITEQLVNSSLVFSFKLRYSQNLPQIRLLGGDEAMLCEGPICFNDTHPVVMVHSPADMEPDDANLFHQNSINCPFVRTIRQIDQTKCHFMCRCERWVDSDGFCDSQFVVVISPSVMSSAGNETVLCGIKERSVWLPWVIFRWQGIFHTIYNSGDFWPSDDIVVLSAA